MNAKMKYILPFSPFIVVIASYLFVLYLGVCDICYAMGLDSWRSFCGDTGAGYLFIMTTVIFLPSAIIISGIWLLLIWLKKRRQNRRFLR